MRQIGRVKEVVRYPIKSMAGVPAESAFVGWHGLTGDRRFAFRRIGDNGGFPWLTASRLPELILHTPDGIDANAEEPAPTHVRMPDGERVEIDAAELAESIAKRCGIPVELMKFKHGIFDDGCVSVINTATIAAICEEASVPFETRRFRGNIVVESVSPEPFQEDSWIGQRLVFGDGNVGPIVSATMRDIRCMMINLNPETAAQDPAMMKAVVRMNDNNAGAYGTVVRTGTVRVGDPVHLLDA